MKAVRKLSLRREALAELVTDELSQVAAGTGVTCLISTPTWCGAICDLTEKCML